MAATQAIAATSITAFLLATTEICAAASQGAIKQSVWQPPCTLASELNKAPQLALMLINEANEAIEKAQKQTRKLEIYATMQQDADQYTKYAILAAAMADATLQIKTQAKESLKTAVQYVAAAEFAAGDIHSFAKLLKQSTRDASHSCVADSQADTALPTGQVGTQLDACLAGPAQTISPATKQSKPTAAGLQGKTTQVAAATTSSAKGCPLTDTTNANNWLHNNGAAQESKLIFAAGLVKITSTGAALTQFKGDGTAEDTDVLAQLNHAAKHLKDLDTATFGEGETQGNKTIEDLINGQGTTHYLKVLTKTDAQGVADEKTKLYSTPASDWRKQLWYKIEETQIPAEATGASERKPLKAITDLKELNSALFYYQTQIRKKLSVTTEELNKLSNQKNKKNAGKIEEEFNKAGNSE
uniref:Variant surface glycoprotein 1125.2596 n=1 Tax=Trypanosoma brucei TaxID=5691 RepID=A0A1J0R844_9TRYP|nr:variant surface glycoprotein 1125.2596 [Trypanosoma brucei]